MISKNFKREEFECKCGCGFAAVDVELLGVLEDVRKEFVCPVRINSACRCEYHNRSIGGAYASYHAKGMAADISLLPEVKPNEVANYLRGKYQDGYGIGEYENFVHVDVRPGKARW